MQRSQFAKALLVLALALPAPLWSQAAANTVNCADGTTSKPGRGACSHHGGVAPEAAAPDKSTANAAATVNCKDGTTAKAGKGACSHHGGIAQEAAVKEQGNPPAAVPSTPPPAEAKAKTAAPAGAPADATALCNDGSYSHSQHHRGACSHHGGVKQWLKEIPK
jgi:hypothetical protein